MPGSRRLRPFSLLLVGLSGPLLVTPPAEAAPYCTFSDHVVRASIPEDHVVRIMTYPDGTLHYVDNSDSSRTARCGAATVDNTARVVVHGRGSSSRLIYAPTYGAFAPGAGADSGIPEIEFALHGVTSLWLQGRDADETVTVGERGANTNDDDDVDLRVDDDLRDVMVFARDGDDLVRAAGGHGTDSAWPRRRDLVLLGDEGDDTLVGRPGRDSLDGGLGVDHLVGGSGPDELDGGDSANSGQPTGNVLEGGPGDDVIRGSYFPDKLLGGGGDDYLEATHLDTDLAVDGGGGEDSARVDSDPPDPVTNVEHLL